MVATPGYVGSFPQNSQLFLKLTIHKLLVDTDKTMSLQGPQEANRGKLAPDHGKPMGS